MPHTYLEYKEILNLLKDFQTLKIQQIFDYEQDRRHAHFFVTGSNRKYTGLHQPPWCAAKPTYPSVNQSGEE